MAGRGMRREVRRGGSNGETRTKGESNQRTPVRLCKGDKSELRGWSDQGLAGATLQLCPLSSVEGDDICAGMLDYERLEETHG